MDAIIELPNSHGHDAIMVFVDRFTKQAHFIPYKAKGFGAPQLANMFRHNIMRLHGLPTDIVSDRGTIFTSNFWRAFTNGLDIKCNFSTAFHPQSDGQTERVNQVLEHYLRTYCDYDQQNWSTLLDQAEFTYNNLTHATTKFSPFEANYGYHPLHPAAVPPKPASDTPAANTYLDKIKDIHATIISNIEKAQAKHAEHYNRRVKEINGSDDNQPIFKIGDEVFLNRKHIATLRPTLKLDQRMFGPYTIIGTTPSPLAFKLDLPPSMSAIHPVFHVSLLEPKRSGHNDQPQDPPPRIEVQGQVVYIVEKILDSRIDPDDGGFDYLVKWKDYTDDNNSWEQWEEVWETSAYKVFRRQHKNNPAHHFPPASAHTAANKSSTPAPAARAKQPR